MTAGHGAPGLNGFAAPSQNGLGPKQPERAQTADSIFPVLRDEVRPIDPARPISLGAALIRDGHLFSYGLDLGEIRHNEHGYHVKVADKLRTFHSTSQILTWANQRIYHLDWNEASSSFSFYLRGRRLAAIHRRRGGFAFDRGPAATLIFPHLSALFSWALDKDRFGEIDALLAGGVHLRAQRRGQKALYLDNKRLATIEQGPFGSSLIHAGKVYDFPDEGALLTWANNRFAKPLAEKRRHQEVQFLERKLEATDPEKTIVPRHPTGFTLKRIANLLGLARLDSERWQEILHCLEGEIAQEGGPLLTAAPENGRKPLSLARK